MVLKIFDPTLQKHGLTPEQIAIMIQREQGMSDYYNSIGVKAAQTEDIISLLDDGIQRQQKIGGQSAWDFLPESYGRGDIPEADAFFDKIGLSEARMLEINGSRYGIEFHAKLSVSDTSITLNRNAAKNAEYKPVGTDLGKKLSNIIVRFGKDGRLEFYLVDM